MLTRKEYEDQEAHWLAPYAIQSRLTQGRVYPEEEHPLRTAFQRDRDRIIHSTAFRRLEYKTQVYITHEGDYYRTRLTHTLEVSQIARTLARLLRLNEELTESIALGHDLGHTPFGHAGEYVLHELMKTHDGFEHNQQGLRIVDLLEEKYSRFPGLNLTYEVREGILKHTVFDDKNPSPDLVSRKQPTLECQIVDISDEIAYNTHDMDDALQQGLIREKELDSVEFWTENYQQVLLRSPGISKDYANYETINMMIDRLVQDLVAQTEKNIRDNKILSSEDIRRNNEYTARFSPDIHKKNILLKKFLMQKVYCHLQVEQRNEIAQRIIKGLFNAYLEKPELLPEKIRNKSSKDNPYRSISDYIASMTDRFAQEEYKRITG